MITHKRLSFSAEEFDTFSLLFKRMDDINRCKVECECDMDTLLVVKSHLNELAREVKECNALIDGAIETLQKG